MNIVLSGDLHIHLHHPGVEPRLDEVLQKLDIILNNQETEMDTLVDLAGDVADEDTVIDGAVVLINGFAAQLAAAGTDPTKLAALRSDVQTHKASLAAAVIAGTPAPPAPPVGGTPVTVPGTPVPPTAPLVTPDAAATAAAAAVAANPPATA